MTTPEQQAETYIRDEPWQKGEEKPAQWPVFFWSGAGRIDRLSVGSFFFEFSCGFGGVLSMRLRTSFGSGLVDCLVMVKV